MVQRGYNYEESRTRNGLSGIITNDTGKTDRDLRVEARGERYTVEVPKGTRVTRDGRPVSVHELREGDRIRVQGDWRSDRMRARRVEAFSDNGDDRYDSRYDSARVTRSYSGVMERLDRRSQTFRLRTRTGTYDVDALDADIVDNGRSRRFADLREGDDVRVYVSRERGRTLIATRIIRGDDYTDLSDSRLEDSLGTISGRIEAVDFLNRTVRLRTDLAPITVRVPTGADLYSDQGDRVDFRDLHEGDTVRVQGTRNSLSGYFVAVRVDLFDTN
jgi:hypothetical protein